MLLGHPGHKHVRGMSMVVRVAPGSLLAPRELGACPSSSPWVVRGMKAGMITRDGNMLQRLSVLGDDAPVF
jgi:hypothetical protein